MPDDPKPSAPQRPATRSLRPAGRPGVPPPAPASGGGLRLFLMLGIIGSSVVLLALIAVRLYQKTHQGGDQGPVDIEAEWKAAFDKAKTASGDILQAESKVWMKAEELTPDDFERIRAGLKILEDSHEDLVDLVGLLRQKGATDSQEMVDIGAALLKLKAWILDASDVAGPDGKPPEYGGLYIPMNLALGRSQKGQKELLEFEKGREETLKRADSKEMDDIVKRIAEIEKVFGAAAQRFTDLDDYVREGLARPDLTPRQLPDLEILRDEGARATMALKQARDLRSKFLK